jgi:pimeloyl-ACP methyl ester carboxylesterase
MMLDTTPCQLTGGQLPSCSQKLSLGPALERFRREALWGACDTGRYRCPYVLWGRGPALVFIPGLCDDPWSFLLPMSRLCERFCCIAYAMPTGTGDGARLDSYRHADLVSDLFALLDHMGLERTYLLGTSFGATVALSAAHEAPERFPRLLLQGGFARRPLAWAEVLLASWARWWPGKLEHLPLRRLVLTHALELSFAQRDPEVWQYYLEHDGAQRIAAVAHRARWLHQLDLRPILSEIRQPVLLICGDRDPLVSKACEEDLLRGLPHAARAEIEHCGHLPQYTHPEVLCEVVERFLMPPAEPNT